MSVISKKAIQKAEEIYKSMTSYTNPSEMNGISKGWMVKCIAKALVEFSTPSTLTHEPNEPSKERKEAVEFAEWLLKSGYDPGEGQWITYLDGDRVMSYTTSELYEIFKNK